MSDIRYLAWSNRVWFPHNTSAWSNPGVTNQDTLCGLEKFSILLLAVASDQPRLLLFTGDGSGAYDVVRQSYVSA